MWFSLGLVWFGFGFGLVWFGLVCFGLVWFVLVWFCLVWVWAGLVWRAVVEPDTAGEVGRVEASFGLNLLDFCVGLRSVKASLGLDIVVLVHGCGQSRPSSRQQHELQSIQIRYLLAESALKGLDHELWE